MMFLAPSVRNTQRVERIVYVARHVALQVYDLLVFLAIAGIFWIMIYSLSR